MKTTLKLMLMLTLACSMFAVAQMDSDSSMKKDNMSGKKMSMTGCIAEKDGKYMMVNKDHPDGVQLMSSEDLKPHVGHKVKVTGMMSEDSMKSDDKKDNTMKHDDMGMMNVSSMKMISDQCDMSKMMNK